MKSIPVTKTFFNRKCKLTINSRSASRLYVLNNNIKRLVNDDQLYDDTINNVLGLSEVAESLIEAYNIDPNLKTRRENDIMSVYSDHKQPLVNLAITLERSDILMAGCTLYETFDKYKDGVVYMTNRYKDYKYQVKFNNSPTDDFINWIITSSPNLKYGPKFNYAVIHNKSYLLNGLYFYVPDNQTLTLVTMLANQAIQYIKLVEIIN